MKYEEEGLFWRPFGGCGTNDMWASTHEYTGVTRDEKTGKLVQESILVDLGAFVNASSKGEGQYNAVVPGVGGLIPVPGQENDGEPKAKALLLTHAHADHIGGVVEYALMGAKLPPIYASGYTLNILKNEFASRGLDWKKYLNPQDLHEINAKDVLQIGNMTVEVGAAPHSIPGSFCFKIKTPNATVFHSGDMKEEKISYIGEGADLSQLQNMGKDGIDFAVMDACDTKYEGHTRSEADVHDAYVDTFNGSGKGRQVVAVVPAAHLERIATVLQAAKDAGRDVVIDGGPFMIAQLTGLNEGELKKRFPNLRAAGEVTDRSNAVLITSGIHGLSNGKNTELSPLVDALAHHRKYDKMDDNALILVGHAKENLSPLLADKELYPDVTIEKNPDLHVPGHAQEEDFMNLLRALDVKHVAPVHVGHKYGEDIRKKLIDGHQADPSAPLPMSRVLRNGDVVRIVHGQTPQIVETRDVDAYCLKHEEKTGENGEKILSPAEKPERRSYRDLGINTEVNDTEDLKIRAEIQYNKDKTLKKRAAGKAAAKRRKRSGNGR